MKRTRVLSIFTAVLAIVSIAMVTGCDKNEEIVEIWDYPWYLNPDTGRCSDGKLYFRPDEFYTWRGGGFITPKRISVETIQTPYGECNAINSGGKFVANFTFEGEEVFPYTDFDEFKKRCIQTGFRPAVKTLYDPELHKLQPITDWEDYNLCTNYIKSIKIITEREIATGFPGLAIEAGADLEREVFIRSYYLDDCFEWHRNHKDRPCTFHNFLPDANYNYTGEFPVFVFNYRPQKHLMNKFSLSFRCFSGGAEKGDYPMTMEIEFDNGEILTADLLIKNY